MSMPGSFNDPFDNDVDESTDPDFEANDDTDIMDEDDDLLVDAMLDEEDEEADGDEDEEEAGGDVVLGTGGGVNVGINRQTGEILLLRGDGTQVPLGARTVGGMTGRDILQALFRRTTATGPRFAEDEEEDGEDDDADEDDEEDLGEQMWGMRGMRSRSSRKTNWYPVVKEPVSEGVQLLRSGEFGPAPPSYAASQRKYSIHSTNLASQIDTSEYTRRHRSAPGDMAAAQVPNSSGTEVATYNSRIYSGQYSDDGSFFYTCSQAFRVYIYDMTVPPNVLNKSTYDTEPVDIPAPPRGLWGVRESYRHRTSLQHVRTFQAREMNCRWTITDATLSPDNNWMIYSSITPVVHMVKTRGEDAVLGLGLEAHEQEELDFSRGSGGGVNGLDGLGIWSLKFSSDGREIAVGCQGGRLAVYDVEARRTVMTVRGHEDDTNAVCFADRSDSNVIVSGSDDSLLKIWDRRSLRTGSRRCAGVLVGHTEGITYVEGKGDGRYVLSNGKDQGVKLWDLRKMYTGTQWEGMDRVDAGIPGWDYRNGFYRKPQYRVHPQDNSVMTYRGHKVLQTLIRAHFSPIHTTGQQYIYSGAADGRIHIWSLDGRIVQVLDRTKARPLSHPFGF